MAHRELVDVNVRDLDSEQLELLLRRSRMDLLLLFLENETLFDADAVGLLMWLGVQSVREEMNRRNELMVSEEPSPDDIPHETVAVIDAEEFISPLMRI